MDARIQEIGDNLPSEMRDLVDTVSGYDNNNHELHYERMLLNGHIEVDYFLCLSFMVPYVSQGLSYMLGRRRDRNKSVRDLLNNFLHERRSTDEGCQRYWCRIVYEGRCGCGDPVLPGRLPLARPCMGTSSPISTEGGDT